MPLPLIILLAAVWAAAAPLAAPQHPPLITHETRADVIYRAFEKELTAGDFDPRAGGLFGAAEGFTRTIFQVFRLSRGKNATYRYLDNDVLLAQWKFEGPAGAGSIILKDTPYYSDYALRIEGCAPSSQTELERLLGSLLVWNSPPVGLMDPKRFKFMAGNGGGAPTFSGRTLGSQFPLIRDFILHGVVMKDACLVSLRVGKDITSSRYPVPPYVPERFPALSALARQWSFDRLWKELGKAPDASLPDFTERRDEVLIEELLERGLSAEQFADLLTGARPEKLFWRAKSALWQASRRNLIGGYFDSALEAYRSRLGRRAESEVADLFRFAGEAGCSTHLEVAALNELREGVFEEGPLHYIGKCVTSDEALREVESRSVDRRNEGTRRAVVESIKRRLQSRED